jgi:hypothetical protein
MALARQRQTIEGDLTLGAKMAIVEMAVAHDYASEAQCDPWQFAVELSRLTDLGLTPSDLRWLVLKGYATHAREVTQAADVARKFVPVKNMAFPPGTCFLLTDAGLSFVGSSNTDLPLLRIIRESDGAAAEQQNAAERENVSGASLVPRTLAIFDGTVKAR